MRERLRDMPSADELAQLYAAPHEHSRWADHVVRAEVTIALGATLGVARGGVIADLSCGDAHIPRSIARAVGGVTVLGDFAPGYRFTGPIEETIDEMRSKIHRRMDLFVCCETLEHLKDPETVLEKIRDCSDRLCISTPDGETKETVPPNLEHVWGWDVQAVEEMLTNTRWNILVRNDLRLQAAGFMYDYQIYICE